MVVTITKSQLNPEQLRGVEEFLVEFLPRLKRQPGVVEILHWAGGDDGSSATTLIVWESEEDVGRYREGTLIEEAIALEQKLGLASTREGPFPPALVTCTRCLRSASIRYAQRPIKIRR